jgi:hypothetical protein
MGPAVAQLLQRGGNYSTPEIYQDYACRDRVIVAHKPADALPNSGKGRS